MSAAARTSPADDCTISADELFTTHFYIAELDAALVWEAGASRPGHREHEVSSRPYGWGAVARPEREESS